MRRHLRGADRHAIGAVQQFVAARTCDACPLLEQVWQDIASDLGDDAGVLIVDGSDVPHQGPDSLGVKRPDWGQVSTPANGQAGVFVGYAPARRGTA